MDSKSVSSIDKSLMLLISAPQPVLPIYLYSLLTCSGWTLPQPKEENPASFSSIMADILAFKSLVDLTSPSSSYFSLRLPGITALCANVSTICDSFPSSTSNGTSRGSIYLMMMGVVSGEGGWATGRFSLRTEELLELLGLSLSFVGRRGMNPLLEVISSRFLQVYQIPFGRVTGLNNIESKWFSWKGFNRFTDFSKIKRSVSSNN